MNTGPADTRSPHLDLEDLIAEANGQAIDDRGQAHLTSCEHCRAEANRWNLVAGGVRSLIDATPETAPPARPRHTRLRLLARPRPRTVLAASAAAALVLLAGVGYGAGAIHIGHAPGPVLTAVSGCTALERASGTLEQASGASLVIRPASGQPVTVTTGPQTLLVMSGALLNDVTDGASVLVLGSSSGGTIAARSVTVGPGASTTGPAGRHRVSSLSGGRYRTRALPALPSRPPAEPGSR
jgi:anti-sigma factor RsiW